MKVTLEISPKMKLSELIAMAEKIGAHVELSLAPDDTPVKRAYVHKKRARKAARKTAAKKMATPKNGG